MRGGGEEEEDSLCEEDIIRCRWKAIREEEMDTGGRTPQ